MESFASSMSRLFFVVAMGLLALSIVEGLVNVAGYTIMRGTYSAGRLLELAALLLIFVMAVVMRQVRDELRRRST